MGKAKWESRGAKRGRGKDIISLLRPCQGKTLSLPGSCAFVPLSSGTTEVPQKPTQQNVSPA